MFLSRKSNNNLYLPNSSPKCFNAVPRVWAARMRTLATYEKKAQKNYKRIKKKEIHKRKCAWWQFKG